MILFLQPKEYCMNTKRCTGLAVVALFAVASIASVFAQDNAKWTGTWKMIPARSKFTGDGPASVVIKLDLKEGTLTETMTIGTDNGERAFTATYTTDGKVTSQEVMGRTAKTFAKWEKDVLVIDFNADGRAFVRKFSLSEDGKTMTVAVHQSGDQGDRDETLVMEKQ
jgi:hypothetical protein